MMRKLIDKIIENELKPSVGCTEPSAIAYAIASGKKYVSKGETIRSIKLLLSTNVLKNVLAVTLPNTNLHGIELIILLGLLCDDADKLTIFGNINDEMIERANELKKRIDIDVDFIKSEYSLYIQSDIKTDNHEISTIMINDHDIIRRLIVDGETLLDNPLGNKEEMDYSVINYDDIIEYVTNGSFNMELIKEVESCNSAIAQYGLDNASGFGIGKGISSSKVFNDNVSSVIAKTVAGVDARMDGVMKKVYINSGSGNQGIVSTVPIIEFANYQNIDDRKKYQALVLSHLTSIYIHSKQNKLSTTCGIEIASCGVAAAICYMLGGTKSQIEGAMLNTLCANFGVLCDGAKETCALKAMSGVSTAINAAKLAINNVFINRNFGIVSSNFEETLEMLANIENDITKSLDDKIMKTAFKNCQ